jgi:hypothetical protein
VRDADSKIKNRYLEYARNRQHFRGLARNFACNGRLFFA